MLQAAIASLQLESPVDWPQVVALYGQLAALTRSPVVELNRAVAIAEAGAPEAALAIVDALALDDYRYLHSTRAELLRRLGRLGEAAEAYRRALALGPTEPERRFLAAAPLSGFPGDPGVVLSRRADGGNVTRSDLVSTAATAALELLPDGVLVVCDGEVVLANRALARLTGEDLTGWPAPDWLPADGGSGEVVVRGRSRFVTVAPCSIGSVVTVRDAAAPSVLAHRASHDGLTGLLNQRAFRERLAAESERCAVDGRPLSLVVIDLDHFKAINDVHGHPTGDRVLAEAAARIAGAARAVDAVGRIGGEEFAWLLADDDASSALLAAQRLRAALTDTPFVGGLHVTASMGICDLSTARDPESLLARADEALYWAKAFGRDAALVWSARTAARIARGRAGGSTHWPSRQRRRRGDGSPPTARASRRSRSRWPRRSAGTRATRLACTRPRGCTTSARPRSRTSSSRAPARCRARSSSTCASTPASAPAWRRACSTPSNATGSAITTSAGTAPATRRRSRPARSPRARSSSRSPTRGTR